MRIGIIGLGNVGGSLLRGLHSLGIRSGKVNAFDANQQRQRQVVSQDLCQGTSSVGALCSQSELVFVCVPGYEAGPVIAELAACPGACKAVIVFSTGITYTTIAQRVAGSQVFCCRAITNVGSRVALATTLVYFPMKDANSSADPSLILKTLENLGRVILVSSEADLDKGALLSGCGPAIIASVIDGLLTAGRSMGVSEEMAVELCCDALRTTAALLGEGNCSPSHIVELSCMPGGSLATALGAQRSTQLRDTAQDVITAMNKNLHEILLSE